MHYKSRDLSWPKEQLWAGVEANGSTLEGNQLQDVGMSVEVNRERGGAGVGGGAAMRTVFLQQGMPRPDLHPGTMAGQACRERTRGAQSGGDVGQRLVQ